MTSRSSSCSGCGLAGCAVMVVLFVLVAIVGSNTPHNSATTAPSPSSNTAEYDAGFVRGKSEGADHARSGAGMPLPVGMNWIADMQAQAAHPANVDAWEEEFKAGFKTGFTSVKSFNRNDADWEQLSWQNAHRGVKLYNYGGKHEATIRKVDPGTGIIVVRYRNGEVEPKDLAAVSQYWWVRKK
jgi:hypothetical protein